MGSLLSNIFLKKIPKNLIFLSLICFSLSLSYFRVFELYELQSYDWRCQLRGSRPVSQDIVLIDIWDDTLKELGAWPFDRTYHADLIKILSAYGAKAVGLDILFVEPRTGDEAVAKSAAKAGNVYFVQAFLNPTNEKGRFTALKVLAPVIGSYQKSAKGIGHVNTEADMDGKRRRVFPIIYRNGQRYFQLSFRIFMDVLGIKESEVKHIPGKSITLSKDFKVPLDDQGFFLVNYAGKWEKTFKHYSYYDILAAYLEGVLGRKPRIDLREFKGKVCFVGLTSLGSHDTSPVPIQSIYPMVGMYANVLNSLVQKDFIHRLDRAGNLAVVLFLMFWIAWMSVRLKPLLALGYTLLTLFSFAGTAVLAFIRWGWWVDLFCPLALSLAVYAVATLTRSVLEMHKRELIENELKIASQIQRSFLPASAPEVKGIEIAVYMKPAKQVGGDLYTFLKLGDGKIGVMIGDVSGKGTPAALFMAKVVSEFKFSARTNEEDPARVLAELNRSIASESTGGLFVTLSYLIFDLPSRTLLFANGGHLPLVFVDSGGKSSQLSAEQGMPIGVTEDVSFSDFKKVLRAGDYFALYSDGVSEARNRKKEEYGVERFQKLLAENRFLSADALLKRAMNDLNHFMGKAEQHDDITLILIKIGES